jgi:TonB family protein
MLTQISFPIKIALTPLTVTTISLMQPETALQETLSLPAFPGKGKYGRARSPLPGSGSNSGTSPLSHSSPSGRPPENNPYNFLSSGRLNLKSPPSAAFNLTLSVPAPFVASTLSTTPKNRKWFLPGESAAGPYRDEIQFNEAGPGDSNLLSRMPFNIQDKEAARWTQSILTRIEQNWFIPTVTRVGFSGQVEITLTVDRSGKQLSLAVARSSSREALDQAALNAMKASLPFPPLPENLSARTFVFHFVFTYNA